MVPPQEKDFVPTAKRASRPEGVALDIRPIPVKMSENAQEQLKRYLRDRVRSIRSGLKELHENRLVKWRKMYEAIPAERTREFPFHNASNLVVPVIAIHSDTLLARVMSAVFKTKPMWVSRVLGAVQGDEHLAMRNAFEEFLQFCGLEPAELDLYRIYHEWFGEAIRVGTSVIKSPWEKDVEDQALPAGDGLGKIDWEAVTLYEGPRPEKLAFEDFGAPPSAKTLEQADFKYHRIRYQRYKLEERAARGFFDKDAVKQIMSMPDRTQQDFVQAQKERDSAAKTVHGYGYAEWDVYECWFRYRFGDYFTRMIAWYHEKSNTILRLFHNYYPDEPFIMARLFYRDDMLFGYGFAETLEMLQEEVSQIHNGRRDNMTVANSRIWRVNPDSKLHKGYRIYPSAMLPAEKDEIEPLAHGELSPIAIEEERLTLELAEKRSGVSAPQQGYGAGTNTKRGVYTAIGTLSLLQEGNSRTDLNITDIRYANTKAGRLFARQYAFFGAGEERLEMFGAEKAKLIEQALEGLRKKKLALPIYSSTASVNREVEKQNDLMLTNIMLRHYSTITTMLQTVQNAMLPQEVRTYVGEATKAANGLMKLVLQHFGYDEVERLVPEPPKPPAATGAGAGGTPVGGAGAGAAGGQPAPRPNGGMPSQAMPGMPHIGEQLVLPEGPKLH